MALRVIQTCDGCGKERSVPIGTKALSTVRSFGDTWLSETLLDFEENALGWGAIPASDSSPRRDLCRECQRYIELLGDMHETEEEK